MDMNIFNINSDLRIGLSATPKRYGDIEGTNKILDYFERIITPAYTLYDAINDEVLTKYYYYPEVISLTTKEQGDWDTLSIKIKQKYAILKASGLSDDEILKDNDIFRLIIHRSKIVKNADSKINAALDILKTNFKKGHRWIIYCDNTSQLNKVFEVLIQNGYEEEVVKYYSNMEGSKSQTLKYFEQFGGIIVSIKCLDEGVDIPSTTHALILASSKNSREFIQRRGRVLRRHPDKHFAYIYDTLVEPLVSDDDSLSVSIINGELVRAIEFGMHAENYSCIAKLKLIALRYNLLDKLKELNNFGYENEEVEENE